MKRIVVLHDMNAREETQIHQHYKNICDDPRHCRKEGLDIRHLVKLGVLLSRAYLMLGENWENWDENWEN